MHTCTAKLVVVSRLLILRHVIDLNVLQYFIISAFERDRKVHHGLLFSVASLNVTFMLLVALDSILMNFHCTTCHLLDGASFNRSSCIFLARLPLSKDFVKRFVDYITCLIQFKPLLLIFLRRLIEIIVLVGSRISLGVSILIRVTWLRVSFDEAVFGKYRF